MLVAFVTVSQGSNTLHTAARSDTTTITAWLVTGVVLAPVRPGAEPARSVAVPGTTVRPEGVFVIRT
ncbi:hypothetical protein DEJ33_00485 [Curtobacterium sp. MCPF17_047]|nr:hypothetical protein DEJ24_01470 [Curtobacterium sp. MCPF17_001]PZF68887.1 hypothetical protein DEJ33_00485 [Curtobacterium sp. MCPF17_047]